MHFYSSLPFRLMRKVFHFVCAIVPHTLLDILLAKIAVKNSWQTANFKLMNLRDEIQLKKCSLKDRPKILTAIHCKSFSLNKF